MAIDDDILNACWFDGDKCETHNLVANECVKQLRAEIAELNKTIKSLEEEIVELQFAHGEQDQ